ncbi:copper amine oxidase N-terminal domain-containing protein [uncultured Fenollaria sp.]|uniref:copper amine oxidase N-terminal domain-containing protein n=1 Tax=uncultured Fenollaria sp. TaxID=1686315 RepID=UPI0025E51DFD|nr:copper amine oxidase N-terminal domain-containing protein [uncultured Fenollaria sp.]
MNYKRKFCLVLALLLVSSILFMSLDTTVFANGEPVELEEISFICEDEDFKNYMSGNYDLIPEKKIPRPDKTEFIAENYADILSVKKVYIQERTNGGEWTDIDTYPVKAVSNWEYRYFFTILCKTIGIITNNTKVKINGQYIDMVYKDVYDRPDGTNYLMYFNERKTPESVSRPNEKDRKFARTGVVNEGKSFVYDGSKHSIAEDRDYYTVTDNKATDAGKYRAVFKLKDGYIWNSFSEGGVKVEDYTKKDIVIEWEIKKAQEDDPAYESNKPTALKGTKGSKLSTVALPDNFEWKDPNQVLDATGEKEFKAIYKSKNYVDKEVNLKLTVEEAPNPPAPTPTPNPPVPPAPNPPVPPAPNPPLPPAPSPDSYDNYENDTDYSKTYEHKARRHKANTDLDKDVDREDEETTNKDTSLKERSIILAVGSKLMTVFGKNVTNDTAPIIKNNRTMLPARFVAEALGARVTWNAKERTVYISGVNIKTNEPLEIKLTVGSKHALVNGKAYELDSPVIIENDRTYTPLRFIAEILGAEVYWDDATKVVRIIK